MPLSRDRASLRQSMRRVIHKQGYLKKLPNSAKFGAGFRKAERRWFVFGVMNGNDPYLEYYADEDDVFTGSPINMLFLDKCRGITRNNVTLRDPLAFTIVLPERHLSLVASSRGVKVEWYRCLETQLTVLGILNVNSRGENDYVDIPKVTRPNRRPVTMAVVEGATAQPQQAPPETVSRLSRGEAGATAILRRRNGDTECSVRGARAASVAGYEQKVEEMQDIEDTYEVLWDRQTDGASNGRPRSGQYDIPAHIKENTATIVLDSSSAHEYTNGLAGRQGEVGKAAGDAVSGANPCNDEESDEEEEIFVSIAKITRQKTQESNGYFDMETRCQQNGSVQTSDKHIVQMRSIREPEKTKTNTESNILPRKKDTVFTSDYVNVGLIKAPIKPDINGNQKAVENQNSDFQPAALKVGVACEAKSSPSTQRRVAVNSTLSLSLTSPTQRPKPGADTVTTSSSDKHNKTDIATSGKGKPRAINSATVAKDKVSITSTDTADNSKEQQSSAISTTTKERHLSVNAGKPITLNISPSSSRNASPKIIRNEKQGSVKTYTSDTSPLQNGACTENTATASQNLGSDVRHKLFTKNKTCKGGGKGKIAQKIKGMSHETHEEYTDGTVYSRLADHCSTQNSNASKKDGLENDSVQKESVGIDGSRNQHVKVSPVSPNIPNPHEISQTQTPSQDQPLGTSTVLLTPPESQENPENIIDSAVVIPASTGVLPDVLEESPVSPNESLSSVGVFQTSPRASAKDLEVLESNTHAQSVVAGWNIAPPLSLGAPPPYMPKGVLERGANTSLRETQVAALRREQAAASPLVYTLKRKHLKDMLALANWHGKIWVCGWKGSARLADKLHLGDQLVSLHGQLPATAAEALDLLRKSHDTVTLTLRRLPHASVFLLRREHNHQSLGIKRVGGTNQVSHLEGLAARQGMPQTALTPTEGEGGARGCEPCPWVLTEVNNRPLNLFFKNNEVEPLLCAVGGEVSLVAQPAPFMDALRRALKATKSYKDYLL